VSAAAATVEGVRRIEGLSAVGFAVAFFAAIVLVNVPDQGETRQNTIDFYNSAGEKSQVLIAVYVMAVAALLFVAFLAAVAPRMRDLPRRAAIAAGGAFVALYLAAAAAFVAPTFTL
jgi:drug/metabolite transporter (DMT)-like permease